MPSASVTKASDKTLACKKLTTILQKEYGKSVPKFKMPVLETMLFAVCLEDNPWEKAEAGYDKLLKSYFDLNEIRVSSVGEIEATLTGLRNADWKGLRLRSILRFVFESTYSFDFEKLGRLTLESAQKRLKKIDFLSPFVANFTLQQVLGSHVVCLDTSCHRAAIHLGIVPPDSSDVDAAEFLKGGIKKTDAFAFGALLRKFATDPKFESRIDDEFDDDSEFDVLKVEERLAALKAPKKKKKKPVKSAPAPVESSSAPAKKKSGKAETVAKNKDAPSKSKSATRAAQKQNVGAKKKTSTSSQPAGKKTTQKGQTASQKKPTATRTLKKKKK